MEKETIKTTITIVKDSRRWYHKLFGISFNKPVSGLMVDSFECTNAEIHCCSEMENGYYELVIGFDIDVKPLNFEN